MRIASFLLCLLLGAGSAWTQDAAEPIKIGATVSREGKYVESSKMIEESFKLWAAEINKEGGLLGRPVELVLYDDKSDPAKAAALYEKLATEDKVDLVFSPYGTPLTLAASEVTEKHKLMMLACGASGEAVWDRGYRYVFGMYALADRYFIGLLNLMAQRDLKSVALVGDGASSFNRDVLRGARQWAERFQIEVKVDTLYKSAENELPQILENVRNQGADGLLLSAYTPDCYRTMAWMTTTDYRPRVVGMTIAPTLPDFREKAGEVAEGVFGPSQWEADERIPYPGTQDFIQAFRSVTGRTPSYHAGSAYAACQLYEKAIEKLQTLDNARLRDYVAALDTVTVIGRFKLDPTGRQVGHNPILIQWQKGKKEIVWPTRMRTADPLL